MPKKGGGKGSAPPPSASVPQKLSKKEKAHRSADRETLEEQRIRERERMLNPPTSSEDELSTEDENEGGEEEGGGGAQAADQETASSATASPDKASQKHESLQEKREARRAERVAPSEESHSHKDEKGISQVILDKVQAGAKLSARQQKIYNQHLEKEREKEAEASADSEQPHLEEPQDEAAQAEAAEEAARRAAMSDRERRLEDLCSAFDVHVDAGAGNSSVGSDSISIRGVNVRLRSNGAVLLRDAHLKVAAGHRYGIVGANGSGKSALLKNLAAGRLGDMPRWSTFYVDQEGSMLPHIPGSPTVLQVVLSDDEGVQIYKELEQARAPEEMQELSDKLESLGKTWGSAEQRARTILTGLGFSDADRLAGDLSGGWRMRLALARALFVSPDLLLLDEPTNHLDLEAVMWLESWLCPDEEEGSDAPPPPRTVLIVTHSVDFLDTVCTDTIFLGEQTLKYSRGGFSAYRHMLEQQAKSAGGKKAGLTTTSDTGYQKITVPPIACATAGCAGGVAVGVGLHDVSFSHGGSPPWLLDGLNFRLDTDTKVCLVGANGAGKSTVLKLLCGDVEPCKGTVEPHKDLRVGWYRQEAERDLPHDLSPLQHLANSFPTLHEQRLRKALGSFGLPGSHHTLPMGGFSGGQRARVQLAKIDLIEPHILILDEPTNHLDVDSVVALTEALKGFAGGVVIVSHDTALMRALDCEVWVVARGTVQRVDGGLPEYRRQVLRGVAERAKMK